MARPSRLPEADITAWMTQHGDWERPRPEAIARTFKFADFSSALGFVVRVGCQAEKRDHHPDVELGWGKARVLWTTHDAGGITALDCELAEACDAFYAGSGAKA